jgi:hypothetical protein
MSILMAEQGTFLGTGNLAFPINPKVKIWKYFFFSLNQKADEGAQEQEFLICLELEKKENRI